MPKKSLHTSEMLQPSEDFEAIYKANQPLIYRFIFWRTKDKPLAEDLTSHVFEKAWRSRANYTGGSAKAWLHAIARNTLIDYWRKKKELIVEDVELVADEPAATDLGISLDHDLMINQLQVALKRLPADMESVVRLRFIEGMSCRQTAERLNLSEANVRVLQYRALRKLKGYLE